MGEILRVQRCTLLSTTLSFTLLKQWEEGEINFQVTSDMSQYTSVISDSQCKSLGHTWTLKYYEANDGKKVAGCVKSLARPFTLAVHFLLHPRPVRHWQLMRGKKEQEKKP